MKKIIKNKKILLYVIIALIIVIGIISIFVNRLNFTLMYSEHVKISLYLGQAYELQDIKDIAKETLGDQEMVFQEIETFGDSIAINVKEASDEQIESFTAKIKEKYEIDDSDEIVETKEVAHLRGRDVVKPYIIPMIIVTLLILAYVGVRYLSLGLLKTIFTLFIRLVLSQGLLLSIIAIFRLPIGAWTMPVTLILYMLIVLFTTIQFENKIEKNIKDSKK